MRFLPRPLLVTCAIGAASLPAAPPPAAAGQAATKTIYVTALDNKGAPITDLSAADIDARAAGKAIEIRRMEPAQMPFRIAAIVSDAGTGGFQQGLANFMQKLLGKAEFSLIALVPQPQIISDYSSEGAVLREAVRRVGPRGRLGGAGAQLMEAIQQAAKDVASDSRRPVILVLRVGGEAVTPIEGDVVREDLRKSGAVLYVVSTLGAQRPNAPSARPGISNEQAQMQDADNANSTLNVAQVLGDGSKESGGRHDQVISTTLVPALERLADELLSQYALTCVLPAGIKPNDKLTISSRRKNVKIQGPARVPMR
jgi:hypothetical protein